MLIIKCKYKWRPQSLSELTPMIFNIVLTHLGSEASNYIRVLKNSLQFSKIQMINPDLFNYFHLHLIIHFLFLLARAQEK